MTIKTKEVKEIIKATFPNYNKRNVVIVNKEEVELYNLNWSGGTRNEYKACTITGATLNNCKVNLSSCPPWANPFEGQKVSLPKNVLIVQNTFFQGQLATLTIYANPCNMPKVLTK